MTKRKVRRARLVAFCPPHLALPFQTCFHHRTDPSLRPTLPLTCMMQFFAPLPAQQRARPSEPAPRAPPPPPPESAKEPQARAAAPKVPSLKKIASVSHPITQASKRIFRLPAVPAADLPTMAAAGLSAAMPPAHAVIGE